MKLNWPAFSTRLTTQASVVIATVGLWTALALVGCEPLGGQGEEGGQRFSVSVSHETLTSGKVQTKMLDGGQYADIKEGTREALRDEQAFRSFWRRVHANGTSVPDRPEVDFQNRVVVAVVLGNRPNGGYTVDIQDVKGTSGTETIQVSFTETAPGDGCQTVQVLTSPYVMAAVNKNGEFIFEKTRATRTCG